MGSLLPICLLLVVFGFETWARVLSSFVGGADRQIVPDREKSGAAYCPPTGTYMTWPNKTQSEVVDDGWDWLNDNVYYDVVNFTKTFRWVNQGDNFDSCTDTLSLKIEVNDTYVIHEAFHQFGVSGDVDGYGFDGKSKRPIQWESGDDTLLDMTDESMTISIAASESTQQQFVCGSEAWIEWYVRDNVRPQYNFKVIDGLCQDECAEPYYEQCTNPWDSSAQNYRYTTSMDEKSSFWVNVTLERGVSVGSCTNGLTLKYFGVLVLRTKDYENLNNVPGYPENAVVLNTPAGTVFADVSNC